MKMKNNNDKVYPPLKYVWYNCNNKYEVYLAVSEGSGNYNLRDLITNNSERHLDYTGFNKLEEATKEEAINFITQYLSATVGEISLLNIKIKNYQIKLQQKKKEKTNLLKRMDLIDTNFARIEKELELVTIEEKNDASKKRRS